MPFRSRLGVPAGIIFGLLAGGFSCALAAEPPSADQRAFVDIYRELIEINTTDSTGDTLRAAEAMAARLRAGGIPAVDIKVLSSGPRKGNLVARLRGTGARRPLLLLAHLDVVEAKREDWDFDPFKLQEADGYFRARGAVDDKAMAAIFVANMIAYAGAGYRPERDIILILALTTDEYNPIYLLADALHRLAQFDFPPRLNAVTRAFFERMVTTETPPMADAMKALLAGRTDADALAPLAARPDYNAQIRTTCVATMLEAGHAENALPQTARATVNCRVMPEESVEEVGRTLARVVADEKVAIIPKGTAVLSPPSAANPEVMQAITQLSVEMWPGVPLNAAMSGGYTDSRWLRNAGIPAYGISGLFSDAGNNGVHGRNEQVGVKAVYDSKEFLYRLVQQLAGPGKSNP